MTDERCDKQRGHEEGLVGEKYVRSDNISERSPLPTVENHPPRNIMNIPTDAPAPEALVESDI